MAKPWKDLDEKSRSYVLIALKNEMHTVDRVLDVRDDLDREYYRRYREAMLSAMAFLADSGAYVPGFTGCEFCGSDDLVQLEMIGPTTAASCVACRAIPPAHRKRTV